MHDAVNGDDRHVLVLSGSIRARKCELLASEEQRRRPADLPNLLTPYKVDVCNNCNPYAHDCLAKAVREARRRRVDQAMDSDSDGAGGAGGAVEQEDSDVDSEPEAFKDITARNTRAFAELFRPLFDNANKRCKEAEQSLKELQVCL